ncbi:probable RNA polymerase II nuclear localization protein SLC7A6OS [Lineus longissimus]|uniref:probable RNA polymerase II nuclear localization protein SLC7A6OS n=1 Tax=Lineus longissimus TaxID=88925 RepID=UPI00315D8C84
MKPSIVPHADMATVVRVRRKREVEKPDSLVISCKRQRIDDSSESQNTIEASEIKTTFKYAGTIEEKTVSVERVIVGAVRKNKLEKEYKHHQVNIPAKVRLEQRMVAKSTRYKLTAQKRDIKVLEKDDGDNLIAGAASASVVSDKCGQDGQFCIFDIEEDGEDFSVISQVTSAAADSQTVMCNNTPMIREKVSQTTVGSYVYDLYYVNTPGFDHGLLDNIMTVQAYDEEFVYDGYRDDEPQEYYDEEDDSNDEGNWRNDYPDEDPLIYENEDAEYGYGDDGTRGFDSDDNLTDMVNAKCRLDTQADVQLQTGDADQVVNVADDDGEDLAYMGDSRFGVRVNAKRLQLAEKMSRTAEKLALTLLELLVSKETRTCRYIASSRTRWPSM